MAESEANLPKPEEVLSFSVTELKGVTAQLGLEVTSNMGKKELQMLVIRALTEDIRSQTRSGTDGETSTSARSDETRDMHLERQQELIRLEMEKMQLESRLEMEKMQLEREAEEQKRKEEREAEEQKRKEAREAEERRDRMEEQKRKEAREAEERRDRMEEQKRREEREAEERRDRMEEQKRREEREVEERRMQLEREKLQFEREKLEMERKREEERDQQRRDHERELKQLELEAEENRAHRDMGDLRRFKGVPTWNEKEVDTFFLSFEAIAKQLDWPRDKWMLIAGIEMTGKAREVYDMLLREGRTDYDSLKKAVLSRYESSPEEYRQKFRKLRKREGATYREFADELRTYLCRWLRSKEVENFEQMKNLTLLDQFQRAIPEGLSDYLYDKDITSLEQAAELADEYRLHYDSKRKFLVKKPEKKKEEVSSVKGAGGQEVKKRVALECFNCRRTGHFAKDCKFKKPVALIQGKRVGMRPERSWKGSYREQETRDRAEAVGPNSGTARVRGVSCGKSRGRAKAVDRWSDTAKAKSACTDDTQVSRQPPHLKRASETSKDVDLLKGRAESGEVCCGKGFAPFMSKGELRIGKQCIPITAYRDTGAMITVVLREVIPSDSVMVEGKHAILVGVHGDPVICPLLVVHLCTRDFTGDAVVAVMDRLPLEGVQVIVGNDTAGTVVCVDPPKGEEPVRFEESMADEEVAHSCGVVTRSKSKEIDLADTFLGSLDEPEEASGVPDDQAVSLLEGVDGSISHGLEEDQRRDPTLARIYSQADTDPEKMGFVIRNHVLVRRTRPPDASLDQENNITEQLVLPTNRRDAVLQLAHDSPTGGHLGIAKTLKRVASHFFWPGMKRDIRRVCRSCHVCQKAGKKGQDPKRACLRPVPVVSEPFTRVVIDCVGPLPRSRQGYEYLLTVMCCTTRYLEAFPLRNISTKAVVECLVKFFTTFGLPEVVQSDRGSNFTSHAFALAMKELGVKHVTSSAYHPQSQGALERAHHGLKEMLRCYCQDEGKEWPAGLPFVLFAIRDSVHESLGYTPFELVFGHRVKGPLEILKNDWMRKRQVEFDLSEYAVKFRERLQRAVQSACEHLRKSKVKMKERYDRQAKDRRFEPGDQVLTLVPTMQNPLRDRYTGPYTVEKRVGEVGYLLSTPGEKKKSRLVHVNMLKRYRDREGAVVLTCTGHKTNSEGKEGEEASASLSNIEWLRDAWDNLSYLEKGRGDMFALLQSYPSLKTNVPSRTGVISHDVELIDSKTRPIRQRPYRVAGERKIALDKEIDYLIEHDLIEQSHSAWSSPCVLVRKESGGWRMCTDYRKINQVTRGDSYPIPRIDECIDCVGKAKYITKIDLLKGYYGVPMTERAKEMSAFITHRGLFQYKVMPFGMKGAPATFQRLMDRLLTGIENCRAYLDDIIIYDNTWDAHLKRVRQVLDRLTEANLTVNLPKSEFGRATLTYLGHEIGYGEVRTRKSKIEDIAAIKIPTSRTQLRRFLGMTGYYRRFCQNYAHVATPLTNLLEKGRRFIWTDKCQQAFEMLKHFLQANPVLVAPDPSKPFMLMVDASEDAMGAVLMQEGIDNIRHPVAYYSRKFDKHQRNYSTVEKEALGLMMALDHFEVFLKYPMHAVQVYTDHNPLVFIDKMKGKNQRLLRWSLALQEYSLHIHHIAGRENVVADMLSRV